MPPCPCRNFHSNGKPYTDQEWEIMMIEEDRERYQKEKRKEKKGKKKE